MHYWLMVILHMLGLKKLAVRQAIKVEPNSKHGGDAWDLMSKQTVYPTCSSCYWPILPEDPHTKCEDYERDRQAAEQAEEVAAWEAYQAQRADEVAAEAAEMQAYLDSLCKHGGCPEVAVKDGFCQHHWDYNNLCSDCGQLMSYCLGTCQDTDEDDGYDQRDSDEDNGCPGGCGQPSYACTCAELESLRRHNADPATRGSYWVA